MLYINFKGGGWLFPFYFGVAQYLREHLKLQDDKVKVGGASAGSVTALLLLLDCDFYEIYLRTLQRYNEAKHNPFMMKECLNDILIQYIPDEPEKIKQCCGKLFVGLTKVDLRRWLVQPHVMSSYACKKTCIDVIKASCHIPVISGLTPYYINGDGYFDGDISGHSLHGDFNHKIDVSIRNANVNGITPGVELDEMWVYYPADPFILKSLYQLGYQRANQYIYNNSDVLEPYLSRPISHHDTEKINHLHELIKYSRNYNSVSIITNPIRTLYHVLPKRAVVMFVLCYVLFRYNRRWMRFIYGLITRTRTKQTKQKV